MSLEKEIKQTRPFSSKKEKAIVNIIYTNNWIFLNYSKNLKKYDISNQQYNVLRILNGQNGKPITINEIIERMLDKMSNASRLVDKLLAKGLVSREQRQGNRRACDVILTEKGKLFLEEVKTDMNLNEDKMSPLTDEEFDTLNELLDKMRKKVQ
ncbi:MarR family winged helix-turn-helix transcriptional regulator [Lacihabitans lacunae]|jgi:DNA-binding MarR family transcriptional regulator|uniref:MarR family winged helix-turn-helix transcriptional regulator n=1 Tax=Lacihabitans lacunae TaxID=1028214 RepID=A0ABV7YVN8_9BACT